VRNAKVNSPPSLGGLIANGWSFWLT